MKHSNWRWFLLLIYLLLSCIVALSLTLVIVMIVTKLFILFFHQIPFEVSMIDLIKNLKAGLFGGTVAGIGCWFLYYQNRNNRK